MLVLAFAVLASAQAEACIMSEQQRQDMFAQWDSNGDSHLTLAEYVAGRATLPGGAPGGSSDKPRDWSDSNANGTVELDEFKPTTNQRCAGIKKGTSNDNK